MFFQIFSLLSTGLFIGEGLMTAFLRTAHLQLDEGECCPPDKPAPVWIWIQNFGNGEEYFVQILFCQNMFLVFSQNCFN